MTTEWLVGDKLILTSAMIRGHQFVNKYIYLGHRVDNSFIPPDVAVLSLCNIDQSQNIEA